MNVKVFVFSIVMLLLGVSGFANAQDVELNDLNLSGQIAYVGTDSNIYSIELSSGVTSQLTQDGTRRAGYEFPTWAPDGQLAYFCCSVRGSEPARLSVFISPDGITPGEEFYSQERSRHVYAYWSPQTCGTNECVDLAVLVQSFSQSQLSVELFNSKNPEDGHRSLGEGAPFYYSWSPTGDSLLMHRNNQMLQYYSVASTNVANAFNGDLGNFFSPDWSPVDNRILFATQSNDTTHLTVVQNGIQEELVDDIEGFVSFSWSPNGEYIAYRVATTDSVSAIYVINSTTGEIVARSNVTGVIAFFWSPDSSKIAYVTLSNPPGTSDINNQTVGNVTYLTQLVDGLAWNILRIEDSFNVLSNSFVPTGSMQYLFNNFDQFAQSHSIWSPDSKYVVYSEFGGSNGDEILVTILNTTDINAAPISIAHGTFAIWSYQ